jgi:hypothetical protein
MQQTQVDLFCIIEYIKKHELDSEQLDNLISYLIEYKSEVDKQSQIDYVEEEKMKEDCINI